MDVLRNLFGALTSGIIRLLVTVGILVAVYFFIVRPVLDTTSDAIKEANETFKTTIEPAGSNQSLTISVDQEVGPKFQRQMQRAFVKAKKRGELDRLSGCIQRANGDVGAIRRCARRF